MYHMRSDVQDLYDEKKIIKILMNEHSTHSALRFVTRREEGVTGGSRTGHLDERSLYGLTSSSN